MGETNKVPTSIKLLALASVGAVASTLAFYGLVFWRLINGAT